MGVSSKQDIIIQDSISFTIEGRIVRELGERLVKEPQVALLELIKNAFDADASRCQVRYEFPQSIVVEDDGHGMTLDEFRNGWMRIGTSAKESTPRSSAYQRTITGEKGIGRFAVRYLGRRLSLKTVANDAKHGRTVLEAEFNWPEFDRHEDLGRVLVPYVVRRAADGERTGTELTITDLRKPAATIDMHKVRTGALSNLSPYHALLEEAPKKSRRTQRAKNQDPGFSLEIITDGMAEAASNVAASVLANYVVRCVIEIEDKKLSVNVYENHSEEPRLSIEDQLAMNLVGPLYADIRFYPRRKGVLRDIGVDGRLAGTWLKENGGVAVFDRDFRVYPYGEEGDDWLKLNADHSRSMRHPRSNLAQKHLRMSAAEQKEPSLNYMLRLPYAQQVIGVVRIEGRRSKEESKNQDGLVATADREGFVSNDAFDQLFDIVRGGVEAIAFVDRKLMLEEERRILQEQRQQARKAMREAIAEIEANPRLTAPEKRRLAARLSMVDQQTAASEEMFKARENALEVMSLLGVVAGFMTHEFGMALHAIESAIAEIRSVARRSASLAPHASALESHLMSLREFVTYSQGYIKGAASVPDKPYPVKPRITQAIRVFGKYADERKIEISTDVDSNLIAPTVPVSLYNGIVLNLFTNALKAITARSGKDERRIAFRAWNEKGRHYLTVSDTGIGIPVALRKRVFEPLFTTTESNQDPLGSGMGLGLALVQRCVEAFKGRASVVSAPPGFTTCIRIELPLETKG